MEEIKIKIIRMVTILLGIKEVGFIEIHKGLKKEVIIKIITNLIKDIASNTRL
jgi:hypothetical protein